MREKVKKRECLVFFMCAGPTNPWEGWAWLLLFIAFIVLVYMGHRVLGAKYPKHRGLIKAVTITLGILIALLAIPVFFIGSFC